MKAIDLIRTYTDELLAIRRDIHEHPEIGFEEERTSEIVARLLTAWGIEIHTGIARTGVVGVLKGRGTGRSIGLRADMDALPMEEKTGLPFASKYPGRFHGCGHDGHTVMLLGAARYLAETRNFNGTAIFIFQPAEEGLGGARAMIRERLFERFPCDEVYALHNQPNGQVGRIGVRAGPMLSAADSFDIRILGNGAHGAKPHLSRDPVLMAFTLGQALQSIVSRNVDPLQSAVLSITQVHAGTAYNIVPAEAHLAGTIRTFDSDVRAQVGQRMREIAAGMAVSFGAEITVDIRDIFSVLDNAREQTDVVREVASNFYGTENVVVAPQTMGSEDFADMLQAVPGAYFIIGGNAGPGLHNPGYVFDESIMPTGASILARIVEDRAV